MNGAVADADGEEGFALAEVLVAFAILALVMLGLMRAFAGTTESLATVARADARLDLASRILEERRADDPLRPGRLAGDDAGLTWWSLVEPVEGVGTPAPVEARRLFRVSVGVGPPGVPPSEPILRTLVLARGPDA